MRWHYADVVPFKEIAQELGISEREAMNTFQRGIHKLKKRSMPELEILRSISGQRQEIACKRIDPYGEGE
jgi:predicted DNA-binding protein YlxM (UPF0122 family)